MRTPDWWQFILIALAVLRLYWLLSSDTVLDKPRSKALRLATDWSTGQPIPSNYRARLGEFLLCSRCLGFWLSLAWWGAWQLWPNGAVVVAVPFALSCVVALLADLTEGEE